MAADADVAAISHRSSTADPEITSVAHDSRSVRPGALFCCVPGVTVDGHDLADDARGAGAVALLVERPLACDLPQLRVSSVRAALGPVSAAFWGHPSRSLTVLGVTGTSGKTTTTHLLAAITRAHGSPSAVLGTLSGPRTTPEAPELQQWLAERRAEGTQSVAMEVSSHALAMGRVRSTRFAVAVFTNLSHDHLDFHRDLEDYFEAKAQLFTPAYAGSAVVNLDDERGRELARRAAVPTTGYSLGDVDDLTVSATSSTFRWQGVRVRLSLGGRFNVSNALAAATAAAQLGIPAATIAEGLSAAGTVPGRFEPVIAGQPFAVVIDYAHKPGALEGALTAARDAADGGRVVVVIGAGGERDESKRPEMGEVAARLADRVLLTSDNPRGEDPLAIIEAMRAGATGPAEVIVEPDRRAAIAQALALAVPGDVVVIAGKGHEAVQVVGDVVLPFDDRQVALAELEALREAGGW
jgi:UDP-N-acetylmuramoyl-L-alanyl-D-glutamate--2,6-diaminopimelate ligase